MLCIVCWIVCGVMNHVAGHVLFGVCCIHCGEYVVCIVRVVASGVTIVACVVCRSV